MGENADLILDGFVDFETGEYIDGESTGFPRKANSGYKKGGCTQNKLVKLNPCKVCGSDKIEVCIPDKRVMARKCINCGNTCTPIKRVGGKSMYRSKKKWNYENK